MKRVSIAVLMLAVASFAVGQTPANGTPNSSTPSAAQASPAQSNQPVAGNAQPKGKTPPQAKTQPEYDAFNAAKASTNDPAALEKAGDDFAAKFPESELRILLYENALGAYQQANNSAKMEEMGRKILAIDPDQPDALVSVAENLVASVHDTDLDKDQKYQEATKNAERALQTIETDISIPPGTPQDKVDAYKAFMKSNSYSILGTVQFKKENYPEAESHYRKSIDALPSQPDPIVVLRLALALDKQNKYPEALQQANRAVELTQENTTAGTYARRERERLVQLTGGSNSSPTAVSPTPATAPPKQ
jgi:tetratricopeptide (TPR) repeat protein